MNLAGEFVEDMEAIQEEYEMRMCKYARRLETARDDEKRLLSARQFKNAEEKYKKYLRCNENMKKVLKLISQNGIY